MRASLLTLALVLPGCIVVHDTDPPVGAPTFTYADAGCYWDGYYADYVWFFEADVADGNGGVDVEEVWADVYDEATGAWQDGFPLYWEQGLTWYSAWVGGSTWLDCRYPHYSVDLTAKTWDGQFEVITLYPERY